MFDSGYLGVWKGGRKGGTNFEYMGILHYKSRKINRLEIYSTFTCIRIIRYWLQCYPVIS
jgi:hypothetical protein